jgi:hypothetical protein
MKGVAIFVIWFFVSPLVILGICLLIHDCEWTDKAVKAYEIKMRRIRREIRQMEYQMDRMDTRAKIDRYIERGW